ncbi:MAG: deoxyribose-phosphate aldolase [Armatimonadetes bacterium]|nr:deoxyribose-phosphate aldolase [Armatimonadota bacterium]
MDSSTAYSEIAKMIDHSILHPTYGDAELVHGCRIAAAYGAATCCVKPYMVARAAELLSGSGVGVCVTIGFPHGGHTTETKVQEANSTMDDGAVELDMVANLGWVTDQAWDLVRADIKAVNDVAVSRGGLLKVIFEVDFLADDQVVQLCKICTEIDVAFVKTSTGYGYAKQSDGRMATLGATDHFVELMRANSGPQVQVKAAGGVRTLAELRRKKALGATRIGASATQAILDELRTELGMSPIQLEALADRSGY